MANVTIAPEKVAPGGIAPTRTGSLDTADTHIVRNNGQMLLMFQKAGAGICAVTVQTPAKRGGLDIAERTFNVPASTGDVIAGPFPPALYNDAAGDLRFTIDEATGLTVAAVYL